MDYRVAYKLRKANDTPWGILPHAPRNLDRSEQLIEYYESEWGHMYSYRLVPMT